MPLILLVPAVVFAGLVWTGLLTACAIVDWERISNPPLALLIVLTGPVSLIFGVALSGQMPRAGAAWLMSGGAVSGAAGALYHDFQFTRFDLSAILLGVAGPMLVMGTLFFLFARPRNPPDAPAV